MRAPISIRKGLLAILGLVAMMVGAFENQSLLVQAESGGSAAKIQSGNLIDTDDDHFRFESLPHSDGSEDMFRLEKHAVGPYTAVGRMVWPQWRETWQLEDSRPLGITRQIKRLQRPTGIGVVVLRL